MRGSWTVLCLLFLMGGCRGGGRDCLLAETRSCTCESGAAGVSVCADDGSWGSCTCVLHDALTDAADATDASDDAGGDVPELEECASDGDCDDADPCTVDTCNDVLGLCQHDVVDSDGDGYMPSSVDAVECGGDDCDDSDASVYPGHGESSCFDGVDQSCDGVTGPMFMLDSDVLEADLCEGTRLLWTGSEYGLSWCPGSNDLSVTRVLASGTAHGGRLEWIGNMYCHCHDMAWGSSSFALVWPTHEPRQAQLVLIDVQTFEADVTALGPADIKPMRTTWTGSEFAAVWSAPCEEDHCAMFTRVDGDGSEVGEEVVLGRFGPENETCGLVWTGSQLLAGWYTPPTLSLIRFSPGGTVSATTEISDDAEPDLGIQGCLAWTGSSLGVAWLDSSRHLNHMHLDAGGTAMGSLVVLSGSGDITWGYDLQWSGSAFGVVWNRQGSPPGMVYLELDRVDGSTRGMLQERLFAGNEISHPTLAWNGSGFGVSWLSREPWGLRVEQISWCD